MAIPSLPDIPNGQKLKSSVQNAIKKTGIDEIKDKIDSTKRKIERIQNSVGGMPGQFKNLKGIPSLPGIPELGEKMPNSEVFKAMSSIPKNSIKNIERSVEGIIGSKKVPQQLPGSIPGMGDIIDKTNKAINDITKDVIDNLPDLPDITNELPEIDKNINLEDLSDNIIDLGNFINMPNIKNVSELTLPEIPVFPDFENGPTIKVKPNIPQLPNIPGESNNISKQIQNLKGQTNQKVNKLMKESKESLKKHLKNTFLSGNEYLI